MRVLVTRPEPGGERTAQRLVSLGHEPLKLPLFEARITADRTALPVTSSVSGLIATSARAFDFLGKDGAPETYRGLPVYAVGPATAQAARDAGFGVVVEAAGTARDLTQALVAGQWPSSDSAENVAGGRLKHLTNGETKAGLLYLAGVPRKPYVEKALADAGIALSVLNCYEMTKISYTTDFLISDLLSPEPDVVLLYSANAAQRLCALFSDNPLSNCLNSARFVCLSEDIIAELPERWRTRSVASPHPDEDSLLATLARLG